MNAFAHIKYAARTDVGRKRKNNEDAFGVFPDIGVFCVADGMGGGDDGEIASAAVIKSIGSFARSHRPPPNVGYTAEDLSTALSIAINEASAWIFSRATERKLKGCGSTFVGICFDTTAPSEAVAMHAGDSRLYRIRGSSIKQITRDHSAAEMIGAKDEKSVNPMFRGMILRAVGVHPTVEVERTALPIKEGDRILVCSDGLSKMVEDRKIASIVHDGATPDAVADALISAANEAGGTDNITAVVLFVDKLPLAKPIGAMSLPKRPTDATEDDCDPETSNTGSGSSLSSEADTADDAQTMKTITMSMSPLEFQDETMCSPAARPKRRQLLRGTIAVFTIAMATLFVVFWGVYLVRRVRATDKARESERQRTVRELAAITANAVVAEERTSKVVNTETNMAESIAQMVERELELSQETEQDVVPTDDVSDIVGMDIWEAQVLPLLAKSCSPTNSEAFLRTVRRFPVKGTVVSLQMRFHPMCDATLPIERRRDIAAAITADVQDIATELRKYSETRIAEIDVALSEHTTRAEFKSKMSFERSGLADFLSATEMFAGLEPSSAEAQILCADVMQGVVKWFVQVN